MQTGCKRMGAGALALVLAGWGVLGSMPAAAQDTGSTKGDLALSQAEAADPQDPSPVYPFAGMDDAMIVRIIDQLADSRDMRDLIAPALAEMLEAGPAEPDWDAKGVDIIAEIGALKGGLAGNLLRDDDTEVLSVTDLSGSVMPDLTGFHTLRVRSPLVGANERVFTSFFPGVWVVFDLKRTVRGKASCSSGDVGTTIISRTPLATWTEDTAYGTIAILATFAQLADSEFCVTYEREGDAYVLHSFLPDGRRLVNLDAGPQTLVRVMPAAGLSTFLREAVPTPPAE